MVSRAVLANLEVPTPAIERQRMIFELHQLWQMEKTLTEKILSQKSKLYQSILYKWARGDRTDEPEK